MLLLSHFFHSGAKLRSHRLVQDVFNVNTGLKEFFGLLLVIVTSNSLEKKNQLPGKQVFVGNTCVPVTCLEVTSVIFLLRTVIHVLYHFHFVLNLARRPSKSSNVDQTALSVLVKPTHEFTVH